jgi:hypothetical protein
MNVFKLIVFFVAGGSFIWRVLRELCMRESSSNYNLNLVQSIHLTHQRCVQLRHSVCNLIFALQFSLNQFYQ